MRYIIATATAFALIAGIALGFVVSRGLDGAASAAPADTKVREQNLDGSGLIRVHEQGTANVNGTVNVGNLPAVQDVNVVALPSTPVVDKVYTFAANATGGANGAFISDAMDTTGCRKLEVFLNFASPNIDAYNLIVWESTDGVNRLLLTTKGGFQVLDNRIASWGSSTIVNLIFVEVRNLGGQVLEEGVLHCVSD